ncbi:hypothetical protein LQ367_00205 [Halorubrum lacusprofundi]|nr:hypothetical protein [Halorubrum lacusprofundi]MCG1005032.1 hypothetical protein [Halorubrum lacusprofundi]
MHLDEGLLFVVDRVVTGGGVRETERPVEFVVDRDGGPQIAFEPERLVRRIAFPPFSGGITDGQRPFRVCDGFPTVGVGERDGGVRSEALVGAVDDVEALRLVFEIDTRQKRVMQVELVGFGFEQLFEAESWFDIGDQQRSPQPLKIRPPLVPFRRTDAVWH